MRFRIVRKLLSSRRKAKPARADAIANPPPAPARPKRPEWERVLMASLEQNSIAPPDDVILHAFDLYRDDLYGPAFERGHRMADLYAEISADMAALRALAPELVERAMSRHPFEFARTIEHREDE